MTTLTYNQAVEILSAEEVETGHSRAPGHILARMEFMDRTGKGRIIWEEVELDSDAIRWWLDHAQF